MEDDDVTHGDLVMSKSKHLKDEWVNNVEVVVPCPPLQKNARQISNGYYKETPKCMLDA